MRPWERDRKHQTDVYTDTIVLKYEVQARAMPRKFLRSGVAQAPESVTATASEALSPAGQRLLRIAEDVSRTDLSSDDLSPLSEFVQTYREWIASNRGKFGTQQQQAEQWQLVMYAMVTGPDVEEAILRLIRFGKVVWGERGPSELRRDGEYAALVFTEPFRAGPEGLIAAIWLLALTLCELEFLANARFNGVSGRVLHESCLPEGVARLLFGAPISFRSEEVALLIPRHYLGRPVIARAADLPRFFGELLPLTLGARQTPPSIRSMAAGLVRDDKLGPDFREPTLVNVAARLGMSTATLRRRLRGEGVSYRLVKEEVYNALARDWLSQSDISIGEVSVRLDFSDSFAFRRFFRRLNGISPSAFRSAGHAF
jgi:AraC-like DNA-binding protein